MSPITLTIKTTGIEDYLDGSSNVKMLAIGGPGAGKTRMSSFWPKPIYGDTEGGRASIADRKVPYADIHTSQDMLDFLEHLKRLERQYPNKEDRPYLSVVIDTVDGFLRKVKDEWVKDNRAQRFTGFEAWGYLESRMSMLMTRLLNLDMNVVCLVHHKDKTVKDGDTETIQTVLQLQGDIATTIFNDFDLVGFLGTYWEAVEGERIEKRGLTFHRTPDRQFLKDRYGVMPRWVPITLTSEADFTFIRDALTTRLEGLTASEEVEVIGEAGLQVETDPTVVVPEQAGSGALPPQEPREMPLDKQDKATLVTIARTLGIRVPGNMLKAEIVQAIKAKRAEGAAAEAPAEPAPAEPETPATEPTPEPANTEVSTDDAATPTPEPETPEQDSTAEPTDSVETVDGVAQVNTETGEVLEPEQIAQALGATVVEETTTTPEPTTAPASEPAADGPVCSVCGKSLVGENQDYVRLSGIKFRRRLCNDGYVKAKANHGQGSLPDDFTCR